MFFYPEKKLKLQTKKYGYSHYWMITHFKTLMMFAIEFMIDAIKFQLPNNNDKLLIF